MKKNYFVLPLAVIATFVCSFAPQKGLSQKSFQEIFNQPSRGVPANWVKWQSANGAEFYVTRKSNQGNNTVLSIAEGPNKGSIIIYPNGFVTKEVFVDLSRFRVEGDVPRSRKVEGRYANNQFTFGNLVYRKAQAAAAPQPQPQNPAAPAGHLNANSMSQVAYVDANGGSGALIKQANGTWVEQTANGNFAFQVKQQNVAELLLEDPSRGLQIHIGFQQQKVTVLSGGQVVVSYRVTAIK